MVVNISFTPLYGVFTDHQAQAYLLSIDGFNILLDCGWNSFFDPLYLENLAKVAPSVNVVLLSHPDVPHLGALPYAVENLGLTATVFSTLPVWRMGQMFMYDSFVSLESQRPFDVFNLDHVDAAFEITSHPDSPAKYVLLKYQQRFPLDSFPGGKDIIITPHNAGHMLGGTVWEISKETETVVYAVDFNHRRERHLNPTTLSSFSRPSHLIVGAARALTHTESKKTTDLQNRIKPIIKNFGNVLIPVDTAGRVIELAVQLHDAWASDTDFADVPLVILHDLSTRTFEFARSMIEWMSDEVVRRFDVSRDNLFVFKHVKLCQSIKALDAMSSPMVVLASSLSMEMGFARQLFAKWAPDSRNAVMLVDCPEPSTLYAGLYDYWVRVSSHNSDDVSARHEPLSLNLTLKRKEYLQGEELAEWREQEKARKAREQEEERQREEKLRLEKEEEEKKRHNDAASVGPETQDSAPNNREQGATTVDDPSQAYADPERYDLMLLSHMKSFGVVTRKSAVDVFPFEEPPRPSWDDYGQIVDTTRFMIGEDPGEGAPVRNTGTGGTGPEEPGEEGDTKEDIPTKYVEEELTVLVACHVIYVDNSGLSDGDSIKRLIKEVEPRHATLVGGTREETVHLRQYLQGNLYSAISKAGMKGKEDNGTEVQEVVCSPAVMEEVDITSHSSVLEFQLQEQLVGSLEWNRVGLAGIAFMDGIIGHGEVSNKLVLMKGNKDNDQNVDCMEVDSPPTADPYLSLSDGSIGHPTVYVGTIMLNTLKDIMVKAGMKAEIAGGALCVENAETGVVVLLRKVGAQHIIIEGSLSEEYFHVQDLLYEEFVIPQ
eukprot:GFKZ01012268.1.p1 GENE.GFKZ01012268.1~~GFKZ01012268.1.p1  ORF type:complete len:828 (-),score=134.98 GFKZ01012268.1:100-2583(-)